MYKIQGMLYIYTVKPIKVAALQLIIIIYCSVRALKYYNKLHISGYNTGKKKYIPSRPIESDSTWQAQHIWCPYFVSSDIRNNNFYRLDRVVYTHQKRGIYYYSKFIGLYTSIHAYVPVENYIFHEDVTLIFKMACVKIKMSLPKIYR